MCTYAHQKNINFHDRPKLNIFIQRNTTLYYGILYTTATTTTTNTNIYIFIFIYKYTNNNTNGILHYNENRRCITMQQHT